MIDPIDPLHNTDKEKLFKLIAENRKGQSRTIDAERMKASLMSRVRGQDHIIAHLANFIRLQWGKQRRGKPIANLFFFGPPATGKTELAKALAAYLFDDEKNMVLIDCAELSSPEGKTRLIGVPTGYVGANEGGFLTRRMLQNPKRLVLFDEIEKANEGIFDLFLSMMGDGRLTEQGSNRVADFTQAIIILTGNPQHDSILALIDQVEDPWELSNALRTAFRDAKIYRPEIISRIDHIYVFKPLGDNARAEVMGLKINKAAMEYGVEIEYIEHDVIFRIFGDCDGKDPREITRIVDASLGELLMNARDAGAKKIRIGSDEVGNPRIVGQPIAK